MKAQSGHEGDGQSVGGWVTVKAQSGHEGDEQSVGGQPVLGHPVFRIAPAAECRKREVIKMDAEQPRES